MELINATTMQAGYTMGMKPSGRELLVVAVKGTFKIPQNGGVAKSAEEQLPLIMADTFTGEPGFSAPVDEVDFAPIKHRCDVLLNGSAYAPGGKPTTKVQVGLKVGAMAKSFNVIGNRYWEASGISIGAGYPGEFDIMPISYDNAFGGLDNLSDNEKNHLAWMLNPIGAGYHNDLSVRLVDGTAMPNTEELKKSVRRPNGNYKPMAFGPVGRGWEQRSKYGGTYDDAWLEDVFPFLPADFDERYYQAAPEDQQTDYLKGGEEVMLINLTRQGKTWFKLPTIEVPIVFFRKKGGRVETTGKIDTLVLKPDEGVCTLTWRSMIPLKKNMFEISQILVGKKSKAWWRAREMGKDYYPSLAHLVESRKPEQEEADA